MINIDELTASLGITTPTAKAALLIALTDIAAIDKGEHPKTYGLFGSVVRMEDSFEVFRRSFSKKRSPLINDTMRRELSNLCCLSLIARIP